MNQKTSSIDPHLSPKETSSKSRKRGGGAYFVAAGILLSRISGLIRESFFAHYFGNSDAGDAFKAALKIPNFLQNLFGEGVLSASFIPVYAGLLGEENAKDAKRVAGVVATLLMLSTSVLVLLGVLATPYLIDVIAPGFSGDKRVLTIHLVRIFFPGAGLLVLSAWCLGILNSHRRFFLSYSAPVLWNLAAIAGLFIFGPRTTQWDLAVVIAWALVVGSGLQFLVQVPTVLKLLGGLRFGLSVNWAPVQTIVRNFGPVVLSRGVIQISAYIDNVLASFLPTGAVSSLAFAQTIYLLPVSLFGMSVSAAELPAMSSLRGEFSEIAVALADKLNRGLEQISFFIVPSVAGFLFLGDVIVAALFQTGEFNAESTRLVWAVLAGSTIGLLAATQGRLYSSAFYALKDTRTPLRFAIVRVVLTTALGYWMGLHLPGELGLSQHWGTVGLTASAGLAGWVEFLLLRRALNRKLSTGPKRGTTKITTGLPLSKLLRLWSAALVASAVSFAVKLAVVQIHRIPRAIIVIGAFGIVYLLLTSLFGIPEARQMLKRLKLAR